MKYFLYDATSGDIKHYCETPEEHTASFVPGLDIISAEGFSEADVLTHQVVGGVLTLCSPKPVYVTAWDIKSEWLRREQAPITVVGVYLDCDTTSELRIKNTIEAWEQLPLIDGQLEEVDGVRSVIWTLADNSKQRLGLPQLQALLPALVTARAIRAAVLYAAYQRLKVRADVSREELTSDTTWV